jgi:hypothetical protein
MVLRPDLVQILKRSVCSSLCSSSSVSPFRLPKRRWSKERQDRRSSKDGSTSVSQAGAAETAATAAVAQPPPHNLPIAIGEAANAPADADAIPGAAAAPPPGTVRQPAQHQRNACSVSYGSPSGVDDVPGAGAPAATPMGVINCCALR